jgi:hypothetical protein
MDAGKAKKPASKKEFRGGFDLVHRFPIPIHGCMLSLIHQ